MDNALEIHAHYSKLFEAFAVLPVYDIRSELDKEAAQHYEGGLYREWRIMLQRLKSYLEKSILDSERHEAVKYYIDRHEPLNEILLYFPECRFPLRETDRVDLKARFVDLINCPDRPSAGLWVRGANTRTPEEIQSQCPPILDEEIRGRADVIKQRIALLDEWKSNPDSMMLGYNEFAPFPRTLSNGQIINQYPISSRPAAAQVPAVTAPPQPGSPALETPAPSPWGPLIANGLLKLPALFEFFADCGLLSPTGELTALGKATDGQKGGKAPWAGTLQALMQSRHLDKNVAAICRVLLDPAGGIQVRLNEGTLRDYSGKAGTYLDVANGYLKERGILRN